ncbi:MAG: hypothetical protein MESAZ_03020 [Saezia sanguinis]
MAAGLYSRDLRPAKVHGGFLFIAIEETLWLFFLRKKQGADEWHVPVVRLQANTCFLIPEYTSMKKRVFVVCIFWYFVPSLEEYAFVCAGFSAHADQNKTGPMTMNNLWINQCHFGDCRDTMRRMVADHLKVNCIVTSPPYYRLRDYGVAGQLGLENTVEQYVAALMEVFGLCQQLLADDGTLWLVLADSYAGSGKGRNSDGLRSNTMIGTLQSTHTGSVTGRIIKTGDTVAAKNLYGVPWRVAFSLQADAWILRQDIIWAKPNAMPSSVKDRCITAHEYLFLFSKKPKYYFDHVAIQEIAAYDGRRDITMKGSQKYADANIGQRMQSISARGHKRWQVKDGQYVRNKRSVWWIPTQAYQGAHFAAFPEKLVESCILAGSRPGNIVFDPFLGSGTVGCVAQRLDRLWIGCELNRDYEPLQQARIYNAKG